MSDEHSGPSHAPKRPDATDDEYPSLYSKTGEITDLNTLLVPRRDMWNLLDLLRIDRELNRQLTRMGSDYAKLDVDSVQRVEAALARLRIKPSDPQPSSLQPEPR